MNGFPTIKLFRKETNEVVDYKGGRTLDDFIGFLRPEMVKVTATSETILFVLPVFCDFTFFLILGN